MKLGMPVYQGVNMLDVAGPLEMFYWAFVKCRQRFPGIDVDTTHQRFLVSGNRLTGGGISSGLDESLKPIELLFGDEIAKDEQATTQYFPKPPVMGEIPPTPGCNINWS